MVVHPLNLGRINKYIIKAHGTLTLRVKWMNEILYSACIQSEAGQSAEHRE